MIKRLSVIAVFICLAMVNGNAQNAQLTSSSEVKNDTSATQLDMASSDPDPISDYERSQLIFSGTISKFDNGIVEIVQGHLKLTVSAKVLKQISLSCGIKQGVIQLVPGMNITGTVKQSTEGQFLEAMSLYLRDYYYPYGRLHGQIQSVDLAHNTIHILNQEVLVDSQTDVWGRSQKIPLNKVEVGSYSFVNVKLEEGQLVADSISIDVGPISNAVQGNVIAVQGNIATVLTPNIHVELSNTEIRAIRSCPNLSPSMLTLGTNLRADGAFANGNSTLLIAKTALAELPDEGYLQGILTAINQEAGTITLLGQEIKITPDIIVQDIGKNPRLLNSISPNSRIYVNIKVVSGEIVATRLTPLNSDAGGRNLYTRCE